MKMTKTTIGLLATLAATTALALPEVTLVGDGGTVKSNLVMNGTTVYHVKGGNLTYDLSATAGANAWEVPADTHCVIDIKYGATLTLIGGNARGTTEAGCGILVPESSTLYITGEGTLNAIGGKAADGAVGGTAGSPTLERSGSYAWGFAGLGGAGGAGGGGAAPGIGGRGGNGGAGGAERHRDGGAHNNLPAYGDRWEHWTWGDEKGLFVHDCGYSFAA